jgi:hypothetical protein
MVMVVLAGAIGRSLVSETAGVAFAFLLPSFPDFVYWSAYLFTGLRWWQHGSKR